MSRTPCQRGKRAGHQRRMRRQRQRHHRRRLLEAQAGRAPARRAAASAPPRSRSCPDDPRARVSSDTSSRLRGCSGADQPHAGDRPDEDGPTRDQQPAPSAATCAATNPHGAARVPAFGRPCGQWRPCCANVCEIAARKPGPRRMRNASIALRDLREASGVPLAPPRSRARAAAFFQSTAAPPGRGPADEREPEIEEIAMIRGVARNRRAEHPDWTGPDDLEIKITRAPRDHGLGRSRSSSRLVRPGRTTTSSWR